MIAPRFKLIGRGVYSLAEAERLSGVPTRRIERWTRGYSWSYKGKKRHSPPIINPSVESTAGTPVLTFADLIEIRFLNAFRDAGVSWKAIHIAAQRAKELIGLHHPFSSKIFRTDGRTILAELVRGTDDKLLLDVVHDQYEFERLIAAYLWSGLDYDRENEPTRWWPLGRDRQVVVDPARIFGSPIVPIEGVPTRILAGAFAAEGSYEFVASWYDVSVPAVRDAVEFEARSAA